MINMVRYEILTKIDVILEASEYPINPKTPKNLAEWGVIFIFYGSVCKQAWGIASSFRLYRDSSQ